MRVSNYEFCICYVWESKLIDLKTKICSSEISRVSYYTFAIHEEELLARRNICSRGIIRWPAFVLACKWGNTSNFHISGTMVLHRSKIKWGCGPTRWQSQSWVLAQKLSLCLVGVGPQGEPEPGSVLLPRERWLAVVLLPPCPQCPGRAGLSLCHPSWDWWLLGGCISTSLFVSPFQLSGRWGGKAQLGPFSSASSVWTAVAKPGFCCLGITLHDTKKCSDLYINSRFSCHNIALLFFCKSVITCLCPALCCFTTNIILAQPLWVKIIPLN